MTTHSPLRRLVTRVSLAALAAHAVACDEGISRSGFSELSCSSAAMLEEAALRSEADYLAIRRIALVSEGVVDTNQPPTLEASAGVPCEGASDEAACMASLDALPLSPGWESFDFPYTGRVFYRQLVWTRGDETGVITTMDELRAFLGTIESPEQAALLVDFTPGAGDLVCGEPNVSLRGDGVHVITGSGYACGRGTTANEHLVFVTESGEVTVERTEVVERGDPNCVM